jgi:hypothetical protein
MLDLQLHLIVVSMHPVAVVVIAVVLVIFSVYALP